MENDDIELDKVTYSISEVARIIGVNDSKIRTWIKTFPSFFNIDFDGKRKELTDKHIDVLKFIRDKRESNFNLTQIQRHLEKFYKDNYGNTNEKEDFARNLLASFSVEIRTQLRDLELSLISHYKKIHSDNIENNTHILKELNDIKNKQTIIENNQNSLTNQLDDIQTSFKDIHKVLSEINDKMDNNKKGLLSKIL